MTRLTISNLRPKHFLFRIEHGDSIDLNISIELDLLFTVVRKLLCVFSVSLPLFTQLFQSTYIKGKYTSVCF